MSNTLALVVPVRSFAHGKSRLGAAFEPTQRARLARAMAEIVVAPRRSVDTFVVCHDADVAEWARRRGAHPVVIDTEGLNPALAAARLVILESTSARWIVVAHADLPLADDIAAIVGAAAAVATVDTVLVATDERRDGTNVLAVHRSVFANWTFSYGPGSFAKHLDEAQRLGLRVDVLEDRSLAIDVDTADDLAAVRDFVSGILPDWTPR